MTNLPIRGQKSRFLKHTFSILSYNNPMSQFKFSIPIAVRYVDLDPQWHVNNARFNSYIEQARYQYMIHLKLWGGGDFWSLGAIVADVHIVYLVPIELSDPVRVDVRVASIGNKSFTFEYQIVNPESGVLFARAETVMVAYDYPTKQSIRVPDDWREKIAAFEGL